MSFVEKNTRTIRRFWKKYMGPIEEHIGSMQELKFTLRKSFLKKYYNYDLNCTKIYTKSDFNKFCDQEKNNADLANILNQKIKEQEGSIGHLKGICSFCDKKRNFYYEVLSDFSPDVMFRERLVCPVCQTPNRIRLMYELIHNSIRNKKNLKRYCYEQINPFYKGLCNWYKNQHEIIGSEFLGYNIQPGSIIDGIRHENALELSFDNQSLDLIIANDVFEHVPDIKKTFEEAYRVLKKDGEIFFSIPFFPEKDQTVVRARIENGEIVHLMEKEVHGNPVSEEGSLAFYNFGWDVLDFLTQAGFKDSHIIAVMDKKYGHIDYSPLLVFRATK